MKEEIKTAIDGLSRLDHSKYPYEETKQLIRQLGKFGCILVTLHQGKTIMRARPNFKDEHFISKCQLTYKPQQFNKTYQRASTPNMTMFYGCVIPENLEQGELDNARVIGVLEAMPWLRDKTTKGFQRVTFGRWIVTRDINVIAVVQHENYYKESSYTRELVNAFKGFTKEHPELEQETILISDFFANQFAKAETEHDYDYILSASFTETAVNSGLDGVLYPSVRVNGQGFNVALRPEVADTALDLVVAGECSIYKNRDHTFVDNETVVELRANQSNFELFPVDAQYHAGQAESLRQVGLTTMEELMEERAERQLT
jgi:hypothetical protein